MKVVHVTITDGADGAGIAASRLHRALRRLGVDSQMVVKKKTSADEHVHQIDRVPVLDKLINLAAYPLSLRHWISANAPFVRRHPAFRDADVVHVHNVQYESFFSPLFFPRGRRLVWTLHDLWPLTGNCNYTYGQCERFAEGCGECPINEGGIRGAVRRLKDLSLGTTRGSRPSGSSSGLTPAGGDSSEYPRYVPTHLLVDNTRLLWRLKRWLYSRTDPTFIAPSTWMYQMALRSRVCDESRVVHIPTPIDVDVFRPLERTASTGKTSLLFAGQANSANVRKGFPQFLGSLEFLDSDAYEVALVGKVGSAEKNAIRAAGFACHEHGVQRTDREMAAVHNRADVLVFPSLEDNLPSTILESMACGTPVVAFRAGGIPDMVSRETGYLAAMNDVADLARGIQEVVGDLGQRAANARKFIVSGFTEAIVGQAVSTFYEGLPNGDG